MLLSFIAVRTQKLISKNDPFFSMTPAAKENQSLDLWLLGFMFAIKDVDPRIGHIDVDYYSWKKGEDRKSTKIQMVPCSELLQGGSHEQDSNNEVFGIENL